MSTVRRLLLLLPFAPRLDAFHGGGRLIAQFICEITNHYQVAILYFRSPDEPPVDETIRTRCALVEEVPRQGSVRSLPSRLLHGTHLLRELTRHCPMWVTDWTCRSYLERVRETAAKFDPDLVQAEFHVMGQYLTGLEESPAPRVLVEHEPGARSAAYLQNVPSTLARLAHRFDKLAWERYERAVFRHVNAIVAFSEADRNAIQRLSGQTPVYIIRPGIQIPDRPLDPLGNSPPSLLFVGNFTHPPNAESATVLAQDIFPRVRKSMPEVRLFIVGNQPPTEIRRLSGENIVVTGGVPDVAPYLEQAALFVAPVRSGGGIRIKVMEALAAGKAVVATQLACEGLSVMDGREVAIADRNEEIAEKILNLLEYPEKRAALAENARAWAIINLNWVHSIRSYEALYESLL